MNKFLDESKIIKKNNLQEQGISAWPELNPSLEKELNEMAGRTKNDIVNETNRQNIHEELLPENKLDKLDKSDKGNKKTKNRIVNKNNNSNLKLTVLNDLLNKTMYQLVEREVQVALYKQMMKENGTNESRKNFNQMINNCNSDIRELKIKIDIINKFIKEGQK